MNPCNISDAAKKDGEGMNREEIMKIMPASITGIEKREAFFIPIKGSVNNQVQQVINK